RRRGRASSTSPGPPTRARTPCRPRPPSAASPLPAHRPPSPIPGAPAAPPGPTPAFVNASDSPFATQVTDGLLNRGFVSILLRRYDRHVNSFPPRYGGVSGALTRRLTGYGRQENAIRATNRSEAHFEGARP